MPSRPDPSVPPHKTWHFWFIVLFAVLMSIGYPLTVRSHGPLWFEIVPSVFTFVLIVCIGWFAVRRVQRGEQPGGSNKFRIALLVVAIIFFILAQVFKGHPPQKQPRPLEEKPDYIKKLEAWKP